MSLHVHDVEQAVPKQLLFNTYEAARLLGVSQRQIRTWILEGRLDARKIKSRWYVHRKSLVAFLSG